MVRKTAQRSSGQKPSASQKIQRKTLDNNIFLLRAQSGLTLHELSKRVGISPSYLSRLENGGRRLNSDFLKKLAAIFGCSISDILEVPLSAAQHSCIKHAKQSRTVQETPCVSHCS